jgi:hypothetical protein
MRCFALLCLLLLCSCAAEVSYDSPCTNPCVCLAGQTACGVDDAGTCTDGGCAYQECWVDPSHPPAWVPSCGPTPVCEAP